MRIRAVVAIVSLVLPATLSAQRIPLPRIPTRRAPGPAELPPQPAQIATELAYRRWRLSVESYPVVSYVQSPGISPTRAFSSWTSFGMGTRANYLLNRHVSATLDLTSSFLGGPAVTNTAELGTRIHPEWAEHKLLPFVDLRAGFVSTYDRRLGSYDDPYPYTTLPGSAAVRYSTGFGAIGGAGVEYAFTSSWTLTTEASVLRSRMNAEGFDFNQTNAPGSFPLTSVRYTIGLRYNPLRVYRRPIDTR